MMSHDLGTLGFLLGLLALVLAFPISLLANLATPRIRDWWAKRSEAALRKRLAELQDELSRTPKTSVNETAYSITKGLRIVMAAVFFGVHMVMCCFLVEIITSTHFNRWPESLITSFMIGNMFAHQLLAGRLDKLESVISNKHRDALEEEIARLEGLLVKTKVPAS